MELVGETTHNDLFRQQEFTQRLVLNRVSSHNASCFVRRPRSKSAPRNNCSSTRWTPSRPAACYALRRAWPSWLPWRRAGFPAQTVYCHYLDLYRAEQARRHAGNGLANLTLGCSPDFPPQSVDLAALPFSAQGEAELTRELLQEAHQRLEPRGVLLASTDNPARSLVARGNAEAVCQGDPPGIAERNGLSRPTGPAAETRQGLSLRVRLSRPRPLDSCRQPAGSILPSRSRPGSQTTHGGDGNYGRRSCLGHRLRRRHGIVRGCLSGRGRERCRRRFARAGRGVYRPWGQAGTGSTISPSSTAPAGSRCDPGTIDVVVANPPYYAGFRIARFFLEAAHAVLRRGGRIFVVTKQPEWYAEYMPEWFNDVAIEPSKDYWIVRGRR